MRSEKMHVIKKQWKNDYDTCIGGLELSHHYGFFYLKLYMFFFPIILKTIASSWQKWCIIGWIFSTLVLHVREINSTWKIYILVLINLLINCGILSSLLLWEYIYV